MIRIISRRLHEWLHYSMAEDAGTTPGQRRCPIGTALGCHSSREVHLPGNAI